MYDFEMQIVMLRYRTYDFEVQIVVSRQHMYDLRGGL